MYLAPLFETLRRWLGLSLMDLVAYGRSVRQRRDFLKLSGEEMNALAKAYSDVSAYLRMERGQGGQPDRGRVIRLAVAQKHTEVAKFDQRLILAGRDPLTDEEVVAFHLTRSDEEVNPSPAKLWVIVSVLACLAFAVLVGWRQGWFDWICFILCASPFAVSVLLESVYRFMGPATIWASALAGAVMFLAAVGAIWLDDRMGFLGILCALAVLLLGAAVQWVLVRPSLSKEAVVKAKFQTHTAQAAHLKNTMCLLAAAYIFWISPRHCFRYLPLHLGWAAVPFFLLIISLWIAFVLAALRVEAHHVHLLENLLPSSRENLYVTLYYARNLLVSVLTVLCLLYYSARGFGIVHP